MSNINKSSLQLMSGLIVTESKLPKSSKKSMLNFIQKEASKHQLMFLLLSGKIRNLNEKEKKVVEWKFKKSEWAPVAEEKFIKEVVSLINIKGKK